MKLSAVVNPPSEENLRLLAQLGVPDLVYYNMQGMPTELEALRREQQRVERQGLRIAAVEGGPPIDRIVLGKAGRDAQIEEYKRALDAMGRLGIRVLCYNFMPQITADAMVIRTSTTVRERGGALTSGFDLAAFDAARVTAEGRTTDEQMWDNLEYFLRRVVPAAEAAEVKLAMHPDDPPLSPMWQLARIMRSVENFDRLFALAPSPVNGLTLCQGCFAELGVDLCATIRHFRGRIHFVHCRDVAGRLENFHETFPDNGPTDLVKVFQTYRDIGYTGFMRSDHVPHLVTDRGEHDGYGLQGNIFAIGYLKGLMEPIFGKPDFAAQARVMKVLLAQFIFESNTFNEARGELELFTQGGAWLTEEAAVRAWCATADSQLAGSLAVLDAAGCETHPVFVANCGTPAGRLSADCFRTISDTLCERLRAAGPAEAMLLHLHGAACAAGEDDVEGNLLERVRHELRFAGRLVVSLDLHANVTRRMLTHADAITAYRTMPHIDFRETGERAARLVLSRLPPTTRVLAKLAALIPPTDTHHASGRFAEILAGARRLEAEPGVIDVSVFPVQPWMDVAEMGSSVVITTIPEAAASAMAAAEKLARRWYAQRHDWRTGIRSWEEILAALERPTPHPWVLVDSADATTAGSRGTSAEAIARLWSRRDTLRGEVLLWVADAAACTALQAGDRTVRLGEQRFEVTGQVVFSGEGRYRARGQAYTGQTFSMGQAWVLTAGRLRIVVSSAGALCADPAFYECVGLEPAKALAVQVKSLMGWRAGYEAPAEWGLVFDGAGSASLNFARLPFTAERRELFPVTDSPLHPISLWQSN